MMNKKVGVLLLFALLISFGAKAQRTASMQANEVLVINEDNFVDDYGEHHGWIELFNTSTETINIMGCYLTDDKNNPTKYPIPKGDVSTQIQSRQYTLSWADGQPGRGTFHVNFVLDPSKENYVALYDADSKTLIDRITIPAGRLVDVSHSKMIDGERDWARLEKVTPSTGNLTLDSNEKVDNFRINNSLDIGMTITAMATVLLGLFLLCITFRQIGKLPIAASKRDVEKTVGSASATVDVGQESGEIFAVIAAALYEMSDDNHNIENMVLTIRKVQRAYSPWSSKPHSLCQTSQK